MFGRHCASFCEWNFEKRHWTRPRLVPSPTCFTERPLKIPSTSVRVLRKNQDTQRTRRNCYLRFMIYDFLCRQRTCACIGSGRCVRFETRSCVTTQRALEINVRTTPVRVWLVSCAISFGKSWDVAQIKQREPLSTHAICAELTSVPVPSTLLPFWYWLHEK